MDEAMMMSANICNPSDKYWATVIDPWGCSMLVTGYTVTFLFIVYRLTILHFDRGRTYNKLTLLPYLCMVVTCIFGSAQYILTYYTACKTNYFTILTQFLSLLRIFSSLFSMSLQVFEWSQYARMISFQKDHRLETVIVEQR